jgi:transposase-like protein
MSRLLASVGVEVDHVTIYRWVQWSALVTGRELG